MARRHYINGATPTTTTGSLTAGATSISVASLATYPASFPYVAAINSGQADFELVLVTAAVGNTATVTRGYDGTAAQSHASSAVFTHVASAADYDEANNHVNSTSGVHGIAGAVVGTSDSQTLTNKTLTSPAINTPTISGSGGALTLPAGPDTLVGRATTDTLTNKTLNGATLDAASTLGGVSGTALSTAWTSYTPTFTNCTSPVGQFAYRQIGKTLHIRGTFSSGTVTASGPISVSLPGGLTAAGTGSVIQHAVGVNNSTNPLWLIGPGTASSTAFGTQGTQSAGANLVGVGFNGVIEVQ